MDRLNVSALEIELLKTPPEPFKLFQLQDKDDIAFWSKISKFKALLGERYLWLSDEHRHEAGIKALVDSYLHGFHIFYEAGDFEALLGFKHIVLGFKAELSFSLIKKGIWGADFVRACDALITLVMEKLRLKRLLAQTADPRIVKMAKMVGFKEEGVHPNAFMWKGRLMPVFSLGRYGE